MCNPQSDRTAKKLHIGPLYQQEATRTVVVLYFLCLYPVVVACSTNPRYTCCKQEVDCCTVHYLVFENRMETPKKADDIVSHQCQQGAAQSTESENEFGNHANEDSSQVAVVGDAFSEPGGNHGIHLKQEQLENKFPGETKDSHLGPGSGPDNDILVDTLSHANIHVDPQTLPLTDLQTQPQMDSQTLPQTDSQTLPQTDSQTPPQTDSQTLPQTDSQTLPQTDSQTLLKTDSQTLLKTDSQTLPQTDSHTLPQTDSQTLPQTDSQTLIQTDSQTLPQTDSQTLPQTDSQTQPQTDSQTLLQTDSQTQPQTDSQTLPQTDSQTQPQTDSQTLPQTDSQTQPQTDSQTPPQTDSQTLSQTDSQTLPQTDSQTQLQTDSQTQPQTDSQTPPQTDSQTLPEIDCQTDSHIFETKSIASCYEVHEDGSMALTEETGHFAPDDHQLKQAHDERQTEGVEGAGADNVQDSEENDNQDDKKKGRKSFFDISDEQYEFPQTLEEFGYRFNDKGQLRSIDKDEPFEFQIRDSINYNQQRYEALGQIIEDYVYNYMEDKLNMDRLSIPKNPRAQERTSFFFASKGAWEKDKMLILIHGTGVVKAGQWTRKLIINEDLDTGSQIPYIKWGLDNDYGVVVLNPNLNTVKCGQDQENKHKYQDICEIRASRTPQIHCLYVWNNYVEPSRAQNIAMVAHSYGGICTLFVANYKEKLFRNRVFAIGFTDSIHSLEMQQSTRNTKKYLAANARNWVSSDKPLDTEVLPGYRQPDAKRVSAGTTKHEWTSHAARDSVLRFIQQKYEESRTQPYRDPFCTYL